MRRSMEATWRGHANFGERGSFAARIRLRSRPGVAYGTDVPSGSTGKTHVLSGSTKPLGFVQPCSEPQNSVGPCGIRGDEAHRFSAAWPSGRTVAKSGAAASVAESYGARWLLSPSGHGGRWVLGARWLLNPSGNSGRRVLGARWLQSPSGQSGHRVFRDEAAIGSFGTRWGETFGSCTGGCK